MKCNSSEVTMNGHTLAGGQAVVDIPALINCSHVIASTAKPPKVVFMGHGMTLELSGTAAEEFLSHGELPHPGPEVNSISPNPYLPNPYVVGNRSGVLLEQMLEHMAKFVPQYLATLQKLTSTGGDQPHDPASAAD